ncbi:MAG TPA: hypothetical protein VFT44_06405 [Pyrinomonadaceae bacterium]|nr:hypothetical protein [Pyrinomonadaceae bacterium]
MELYKYLAIIVYTVAGLAGLIVVCFTWLIQRVKYQHLHLEKEIAQTRLQAIRDEGVNKRNALEETSNITTQISESISQKLIENPSWLDRFMDETGVTYSASVFGKRIGHFFYEKRKIATAAVDEIEKYLKHDPLKRFCLVIDSGTTLYPVFQEITDRLRRGPSAKAWRERVCVVTNNIPGIQYLMKNAKDNPNDDYSEIAIKCFIVPGKPLSVYAAITGTESTNWLLQIRNLLMSEDCIGKQTADSAPVTWKIIGFVTGNYIARKIEGKKHYYFPVARGEGHVEVKRMIVEVSEEVFVLAPLMKFSFAGVDLLNKVNGFNLDRKDVERAKQEPKRVKYEEIAISDEKKCRFFTTSRRRDAIFREFSHDLWHELSTHYHQDSVNMPEFDLRYWNPAVEGNREVELAREIPHENLRENYEKGQNIWDTRWVFEREAELLGRAGHRVASTS